MSERPVLSVLFPVYNEEAALPGVLSEASEAMRAAPFSYEIVLLDDASTDGSPALLEAFRASDPERVRVLRHERNRGIAAAFEGLYAAALGDYVFLNSSDGQWHTGEALRMMDVRDRYDIVVGRRARKHYTAWRHVISGAFNAVPRLLFGVPTYDAGSIKLFRRDALRIPLLSRGVFREAERIIRAKGRGLRVGAIDVEHRPRRGGVAGGARWGLIGEALVDAGRVWLDLTLGGRR